MEHFITKGPYTADVSATEALSQIAAMKYQLKLLKEQEANLRKDLGVFDISVMESLEIQTLEKVSENSVKSTFSKDLSLRN